MRVLLVLVLLLAPFAMAKHTPYGICDGRGAVALGIVRVGTPSTPRTFYVDDRGVLDPLRGYGLYVYEETNGIDDGTAAHGLQRGGGPILFGGGAGASSDTDICTDDPFVTPDTLWL